ncbi:MAG: hypothetical protein WAX66_02150 [Patescibacteria group bacterium]
MKITDSNFSTNVTGDGNSVQGGYKNKLNIKTSSTENNNRLLIALFSIGAILWLVFSISLVCLALWRPELIVKGSILYDYTYACIRLIEFLLGKSIS